MKALKACFLFTFLFTLNLLDGMQPKMHFFDDDSKLIYEVNAQAGKRLKKLYSLQPMGSGFSCPDDLILSMDLFVKCYADLDVPKARRILVKAAHTYLETINANKKLKPFLVVYPFGTKNIYFKILISSNKKHDVKDGSLTSVSVLNGKIVYRKKEGQYNLKEVLEETFEEADRIVEEEQKGT